ncbi:peptidoglycan editing factor PgeF [Patescibacteria group bacterium]|nr:peptidoglycan editing factor PgeF [Patescibacteria group bacterium]
MDVFGNNIITAMSDRLMGDLSFKKNTLAEKVVENRKKFLVGLGVDMDRMVAMEEVHGDRIEVVDESYMGRGVYSKDDWIEGVDGMITAMREVFLFGTFADCLPVYFFDPTRRIVGLAHAGWRGLLKDIGGKMVKKMRDEFGVDPENIEVLVGPSIGRCCFEVKEDVLSEFAAIKHRDKWRTEKNKKIYIDLQYICRAQLIEAGVLLENILIGSDCTFCNKKYFSYRRDKKNNGIMGAVVGMR